MAYANIIEGIDRRLKLIEKQIEESEKRTAAKQKARRKSTGLKG